MLNKFNSNIYLSRVTVMALSLLFASVMISCADSSTDPGHGHMAEISFSYSPMPAVAGTEITFLFEAEEDGVHTSLTGAACEVHAVGEVSLTEGETGHYQGAHTFSQAGTYEVHFSYDHEGMVMEEAFSITVN